MKCVQITFHFSKVRICGRIKTEIFTSLTLRGNFTPKENGQTQKRNGNAKVTFGLKEQDALTVSLIRDLSRVI